MKVLVRFITTNAAGGQEYTDKRIDVPVVTIGRATDQTIHLRDRRTRLQHAQIEQRGSVVHISANALAGVVVNGRSQRDSELLVGDVIEIGSNVLRVIEATDGDNFAFTFELKPEAQSDDLVLPWSTDTQASVGFSKRQIAWFLAGAVLLFAFLLPSLSLLGGSTASIMRNIPLVPNDGWWLAGPVHGKHAAASTDCQNCHITAFERVTDEACLECHTVNRHTTAPAQPVLGAMRCASCHLEHNEPPALVNQHQGLCGDCHRNLPADSELASASDFLRDHPPFKVSLLRRSGDSSESEWSAVRELLDNPMLIERSNLKFNHSAHLNPDGINGPEGKQIVACSDCHAPEPGGAKMRPIAMDEHCSSCHSLTFDADDPDRTVPHGDPDAVLQVLIEYYSARLLGGDGEAAEQRLRRPGQALSRADRDKAAAEARVQALQIAEDLFERRACATCHEVARVAGDSDLPWQVQPVQLTQNFFPHAEFSHAAHETEVTACEGCHDAAASESASDLLIPGLADCRDCHGSAVEWRNDSSQTPSTCVMCHSFHFDLAETYP